MTTLELQQHLLAWARQRPGEVDPSDYGADGKRDDDGALGPRTKRAIVAFQRFAGLPPNGTADAATIAALKAAVRPAAGVPTLVARGVPAPAEGLRVRNFLDGAERLKASGRRQRAVALILHEVAGRTVAGTVERLRSKGYGIHAIVSPDGEITQHCDLVTDVVSHSLGHNAHSIGVEVVSPYYPRVVKPGDPWTRVIEAPWAHEKRYVLPTLAQAEATARFVAWCLSAPTPDIAIPRHWPGLSGGTFTLGPVAACATPTAGVYAHHHVGNHADGAWLCLYAWLRIEAGLSPETAYEEAARRAEGTRARVDVGDLLPSTPLPLPTLPLIEPEAWTEEDELAAAELCPGTVAKLVSEPVCR